MPATRTAAPGRGYLPGDLVTLAYLLIGGLLILFSPLPSPAKGGLGLVHFGILGLTALLGFVPRDGRLVLRLFRATYPLAALPFFYDAVEHMSRLVTMNYYDAEIIQVEEAIFHCQPSQILYKALPWLPLSELLHLAYALYILLVPIAVLALVLKRRDEALRVFTTTVLGTYFVCYLSFTFFPVNGPFQNMGAIDPAAKGVFFPQLVQRMLERGSSLGTAFPSSHVAVAIAIWLVTRRTVGKLSILFLAAWVGILVGVVYGGYHYAVDAIAGLAVGIACGLFWPRFHQWAARRLGATWAMTGAGQQPAVENSPRGRRADAGVA